MKKIVLLFSVLFSFIIACNTTKNLPKKPIESTIVKEIVIDSVLPDLEIKSNPTEDPKNIPNELPIYNATQTRYNDLMHTKLEVKPIWAKKHLQGKATLTFKPWFKPTDKLELDAKNMDITSVTINGKALKYDYDKLKLNISLDKTYTRNDQYVVVIDYVAKPDERASIGGSAAITQDKGLYFINPTGEDANKPTQLWTQGETESNSFWFPTIDKPFEKTTEEIYITVEDKYKTLSNGLLLSVKKNADGTRTDYWKLDKPHAPYLFMMAIGEYAVVKEKWENIELSYYVEPKFEKDAKSIFPYTPEILSFYSNITGLKYPWPKLGQVVVRDYVSGAMENTSAIIYGEYVQNHAKALVDVDVNEKVVAHEIFHHWFGDYVTCESWSNLTLNEGFANYSEYLWMEHKYGKDLADHHRMEEMNGYLQSAYGGMHDLINFKYADREQMFDAHSYNKGGLILHMLRRYLGDEVFFTSLKNYLNQHAYTDVEAHELRMAFEETSGEDLNWFFNQWFFSAGHPKITVSQKFDVATKKVELTLEQTQNPINNQPAIFELPLKVDIYLADGVKADRKLVRMNQRKQVFSFDVASAPIWINIDGDNDLLAEIDQKQDETTMAFIYRNASGFTDKMNAINYLNSSTSDLAVKTMEKAMTEKAWPIRNEALVYSAQNNKNLNWDMVAKMATEDSRAQVRMNALRILGETGDKKFEPVFATALQNYKSSMEASTALGSLSKMNPTLALTKAKELESTDDEEIIIQICQLYHSNQPDIKNLPFIESKMKSMDSPNVVPVAMSYAKVIQVGDDAVLQKGIAMLKSLAMNSNAGLSSRVAGMFGLNQLIDDYKMSFEKEKDEAKRKSLNANIENIAKVINEVKVNEKSEELKQLYQSQGF